MANKGFQFKQFYIDQSGAAMKVGTDGVLLGSWVSLEDSIDSILDVGSGTGLIALMMAQRSPLSQISAVEIDSSSYLQTVRNFENSPWSGRMTAFCASFQEFATNSSSKFELIVSNPPFFSGSFKTPSLSRNLARHDDGLPLLDLFACAGKVLSQSGKVALILPYDKRGECMQLAESTGLKLNREATIKATPLKKPHRIMLEFSRLGKVSHSEIIIIEENGRHAYSERYIRLTSPFYLKMKD